MSMINIYGKPLVLSIVDIIDVYITNRNYWV